MIYKYILLIILSVISEEKAAPWAQAISETCGNEPKSCILFTHQALAEGGFTSYVLNGKCNDPKWLNNQRGCHIENGWCPCDSGNAAGPWQVHYKDSVDSLEKMKLEDWLNPKKGVKAAWKYWKRAPGAWTTWKTAKRNSENWIRNHPFEEFVK